MDSDRCAPHHDAGNGTPSLHTLNADSDGTHLSHHPPDPSPRIPIQGADSYASTARMTSIGMGLYPSDPYPTFGSARAVPKTSFTGKLDPSPDTARAVTNPGRDAGHCDQAQLALTHGSPARNSESPVTHDSDDRSARHQPSQTQRWLRNRYC